MVVHFDLDALLLEREAHRGADVLQRIDRRHREVAALDRRAMAHVAAFELRSPDDHGASSELIFTELPDMSTFHSTASKMKNSGSGPKYAMSPRPVDFRYASARLAIERGSRS